MGWRVAKALDVLLAEINAVAPDRSTVSDGSIGDAAHSSRASDHNPNRAGVVCARDFTHDPTHGCDALAVAEFVRALGKSGDRRVKYVISNARIASSIGGWGWRPYSGINAHRHHVHVSVSDQQRYYDSTAAWGLLAAHRAKQAAAQQAKEDDVTPADRKAIIDGVVNALWERLTTAEFVPNLPLVKGGEQGADWTLPGVLAAGDRKADLQGQAIAEIHAAIVKPDPRSGG